MEQEVLHHPPAGTALVHQLAGTHEPGTHDPGAHEPGAPDSTA